MKRLLKWMLFFGCAWWVGAAMQTALLPLEWEQLRWRPGWLLTGLGLMSGGVILQAAGFRRLLARWSDGLTWGRSLVLVLVPPIGKYLPGKAFSVIGQAWLARRFGVPLLTITTATLVMISLGVTSNIGLGLLLWGSATPWFQRLSADQQLALTLAPALMPILLHPGFYRTLCNAILKRLGREPLQATLSGWELMRLLALQTLAALLYGGGLIVASWGMMPMDHSLLFVATGAFCLANTAGFLAFFAPAGIGVREGLLLATLAPFLDPEQTALLALTTRLIQTGIDLLWALSGWGLWLLIIRQGVRQGGREGIVQSRDLFGKQADQKNQQRSGKQQNRHIGQPSGQGVDIAVPGHAEREKEQTDRQIDPHR